MRVKCSVCGLYRGATPHSGALHKRIMANRERFRRGLSAHSATGLRRRGVGKERRKGERRRKGAA